MFTLDTLKTANLPKPTENAARKALAHAKSAVGFRAIDIENAFTGGRDRDRWWYADFGILKVEETDDHRIKRYTFRDGANFFDRSYRLHSGYLHLTTEGWRVSPNGVWKR